MTIFLVSSTYLLSFLELASVKYLETRQSCENDFGQFLIKKKKSLDKILSKNYIVK